MVKDPRSKNSFAERNTRVCGFNLTTREKIGLEACNGLVDLDPLPPSFIPILQRYSNNTDELSIAQARALYQELCDAWVALQPPEVKTWYTKGDSAKNGRTRGGHVMARAMVHMLPALFGPFDREHGSKGNQLITKDIHEWIKRVSKKNGHLIIDSLRDIVNPPSAPQNPQSTTSNVPVASSSSAHAPAAASSAPILATASAGSAESPAVSAARAFVESMWSNQVNRLAAELRKRDRVAAGKKGKMLSPPGISNQVYFELPDPTTPSRPLASELDLDGKESESGKVIAAIRKRMWSDIIHTQPPDKFNLSILSKELDLFVERNLTRLSYEQLILVEGIGELELTEELLLATGLTSGQVRGQISCIYIKLVTCKPTVIITLENSDKESSRRVGARIRRFYEREIPTHLAHIPRKWWRTRPETIELSHIGRFSTGETIRRKQEGKGGNPKSSRAWDVGVMEAGGKGNIRYFPLGDLTGLTHEEWTRRACWDELFFSVLLWHPAQSNISWAGCGWCPDPPTYTGEIYGASFLDSDGLDGLDETRRNLVLEVQEAYAGFDVVTILCLHEMGYKDSQIHPADFIARYDPEFSFTPNPAPVLVMGLDRDSKVPIGGTDSAGVTILDRRVFIAGDWLGRIFKLRPAGTGLQSGGLDSPLSCTLRHKVTPSRNNPFSAFGEVTTRIWRRVKFGVIPLTADDVGIYLDTDGKRHWFESRIKRGSLSLQAEARDLLFGRAVDDQAPGDLAMSRVSDAVLVKPPRISDTLLPPPMWLKSAWEWYLDSMDSSEAAADKLLGRAESDDVVKLQHLLKGLAVSSALVDSDIAVEQARDFLGIWRDIYDIAQLPRTKMFKFR